MAEEGSTFEVGYGKPPKAGQFTKGKSGNTKGRPKGSKNLTSLILKESRQPVRINGPHGTKTVTKLQAIVMQLGNKSAQGDLRASREFLEHVQRSEEVTATQPTPNDVHEADKKTMQNLLARLKAVSSGEQPSSKEMK
jgi:Family of unknown function (DUF5681)